MNIVMKDKFLGDKFREIEKVVNGRENVYWTKNGYGSMVVLSLDAYSRLSEDVEYALNEADRVARENGVNKVKTSVFRRWWVARNYSTRAKHPLERWLWL